MKKLSSQLLIGCMVLIGSCSILAASVGEGLSNIAEITPLTQKNPISIHWDNVTVLNFRGIPNESQTGEAACTIETTAKFKSLAIQITGTAFTNGDSFLDSEYQSGKSQTWYRAGNPIVVTVNPGEICRVRFRAISGPNISSQHAGAYTAKLSIKVLHKQ
jgi:hypothetical protein